MASAIAPAGRFSYCATSAAIKKLHRDDEAADDDRGERSEKQTEMRLYLVAQTIAETI